MRSLSSFFACLGALAATATALNTIEVQEQEFVDSKTGDRFVIVGVDYQPGGQASYGTGDGDPLSDAKTCLRDAALMQALGVNTIRTYNVNPSANHDECASIFNTAGIYMLIDVNAPVPGQSLNRDDPKSSYTTGYLEHIFGVVEAFMNYDNLLGFVAGNEIINTVSTAQSCPPYIRAVTRDLKNYIKNHAPRQIPVGYSAADVETLYLDQLTYFSCQIGSGTDMSRSDWYGLNDYSWCGTQSSYTISGYNVLIENFGNTTIPVFFSEYGCNDPSPRHFDEVPTLYGPKMTVMSGGLVYQWTQDSSNFGLVQVYNNESVQILSDYDTLESQYGKISVNLVTHQNNTATNLKIPQCNANLIQGGGFSTNFNIPQPPSGADAVIKNGISKPNTGSLTSVTQTVVQVPVFATNGGQLQNLQIKAGMTAANYPGAVKGAQTGAPGQTQSIGKGGGAKSSAAAPAPTQMDRGVAMNAVAAAALGVVAFAL